MKANKSTGEGFEKAPAGNHPAVLVAIIDLGTQLVPGYQGAPDKLQPRLYFVYELVTKKMTGKVNENHVIAIDLTFSMNEKAKMRKFVEARLGHKIPDGAEYDVTDELGHPVLVLVSANEKGYTRVEGVSAVPDGLPVPPALNKPLAWKMGDSFAAIPPWLPYLYGVAIPEMIRESEEYKSGNLSERADENPAGQSGRPAVTRPGRAAPPPKPVDLTSTATWYVWDDQQQDWGPLALQEIVSWYNEGRIDPSDIRVYPEGGKPEHARSATDWGFPAMNPF